VNGRKEKMEEMGEGQTGPVGKILDRPLYMLIYRNAPKQLDISTATHYGLQ